MRPECIAPAWRAPESVRALVTTRAFGDMREGGAGRARVRELAPVEPCWLRQVHGSAVVRADEESPTGPGPEADAAVSRVPGRVCAVLTADCLPVLFAARSGNEVGVAHAGWRGLAGGVIEATVGAIRTAPADLLVWLGPAIGARAYEVGDEVRDAFLARGPSAAAAFVASRPGHWWLDLYAIARQRLHALGVRDVSGGEHCTYTQGERFYSWRRARDTGRMAALIWLA